MVVFKILARSILSICSENVKVEKSLGMFFNADRADWKYSNPERHNKGWSGKGRVPLGIKDCLAVEGHKLEDLLSKS